MVQLRLIQAAIDSDLDGARHALDGATTELREALEELRELARGIRFGVEGIADRVDALNGRLQIMSPVGVGTTVRAAIPRTARGAYSEPASIDGR